MEFIKKEDFKTTKWSGGETSEIFIYPKDSEVSKRNFKFRISSATCNGDSVFSDYSGFNRYILPLDGEMLLNIRDAKFTLKPYETLFFSGSDVVESRYTGADYNLIMSSELDYKMYSLQISDFKAKFKRAIIFNHNSNLKIEDKNFEKFSALIVEDEEVIIKGSGRIIICDLG